jgi:hypothetical protein
MNKDVEDYLKQKTADLLAAPMTCPEAKKAAKAWLAALGGKNEKAMTKAYFKELAEDVTSIEDLVSFAASPYAKKEFGEEGSKKFLAHAQAIQKAGATHCDCPACTAASAILAREKEAL